MKLLIVVSSLACFIFFSCSNKGENTLVLSNHDAYAFPVENGWEVNTSVIVKGFNQKTNNGNFSAKLAYTVDLVKLSGDTIKSIHGDSIEKEESEEMTDIPVDTQILMDSTYTSGKYTIILNIKDNISGSEISSSKEFELE